MITDSRISMIREARNMNWYSTSGTTPDIHYFWIQPPLSQQTLEPADQLIDGIYIQTQSLVILPVTEVELDWEFAAWEEASDEALILFEKEID